jgi:hypothetical protein
MRCDYGRAAWTGLRSSLPTPERRERLRDTADGENDDYSAWRGTDGALRERIYGRSGRFGGARLGKLDHHVHVAPDATTSRPRMSVCTAKTCSRP